MILSWIRRLALAAKTIYEALKAAKAPDPAPAEPEPEDETPGGEHSQEPDTADEANFLSLGWDYGGFNGRDAQIVTVAKIGNLRVAKAGLTYEWKAGGCEALDAANSHENANCIAALFILGSDGKWRGGKFDWISTDRLSRDFKNIRTSYNGWPADAIESARAFAFCILSADGKRRTNVIAQDGGAA